MQCGLKEGMDAPVRLQAVAGGSGPLGQGTHFSQTCLPDGSTCWIPRAGPAGGGSPG